MLLPGDTPPSPYMPNTRITKDYGIRLFSQYEGSYGEGLRRKLQWQVFLRHRHNYSEISKRINQAFGWLVIGGEDRYLICQHQDCFIQPGGKVHTRDVPVFGVVNVDSGTLFPFSVSPGYADRVYRVHCDSYLTAENTKEPMIEGWFRPRKFDCDISRGDSGTLRGIPYGCGRFQNGAVITFAPPEQINEE